MEETTLSDSEAKPLSFPESQEFGIGIQNLGLFESVEINKLPNGDCILKITVVSSHRDQAKEKRDIFSYLILKDCPIGKSLLQALEANPLLKNGRIDLL